MAVQGPPGQKQHLTTVPTQVDGVGESFEWPRVASLNGATRLNHLLEIHGSHSSLALALGLAGCGNASSSLLLLYSRGNPIV